jgi:P-type Mg2+ transporter
VLPATPLAHALGFHPLPGAFFATLIIMIVGYLVLIEIGKNVFYRRLARLPAPLSGGRRHLRRRAAYFSTQAPLPR